MGDDAVQPTTNAVGRVLVVEDEAPLRRAFARILQTAGFKVEAAENGLRAAEILAHEDFHVIVSDVSMPGMDGLALLRVVRERDLEVPVVLVTGMPSVEAAAQAVHYGACHYLTKPVELAQLEQVVRRAANLGQLARLKREAMTALESDRFRAGDRAGLEVTFARAVDGLWMAYQPIVDARTRSLYGYEALMRTVEPSFPDAQALLKAAKTLGKLDDVGRTVRTKVILPISAADPNAVLFVNVHACDLDDKTLTQPSTPFAQMAHRVVLEITDRASLDAVPHLPAKVTELRRMGFRIAIDDLGAGYAGLTTFAALEPEFVKLDMSLIRNVHQSQIKQKLIRTMTALCKNMGMMVVAEGVESVEERDVLLDIGTDLLQGHLFARPGRPFPSFHW